MITKVCCYGSGIIGCGWAASFLVGGCAVSLYDTEQKSLDRAQNMVRNHLSFLVGEGILREALLQETLDRLTLTTDPAEALRGAQLVQENTPERIAVKRQIVAIIEAHVAPDTIIASSTSGLLIKDIAAEAKHPQRIIGAHPYNPAYLIPLVELSGSDETSPQVLETAYQFYQSINKEPVILKKEVPGFIANRLQHALYREAADLVLRGVCSLEDVDKAACFGPGLRWGLLGPNTVFQLGGGESGVEGILRHMAPSSKGWYEDMASWTEVPEAYIQNVQPMMAAAMEARDPAFGNTNEEIARFRDKGLVMLLKYHGKV
ncbi:MAG: 3-hydroxyacyl-CoA dehydrogenase family protein [Oscillospiraceae bacterium]|nr:3-hydroxyacyl-CoA dehydrogenase family protein [Oscillospiraceae bacterium]